MRKQILFILLSACVLVGAETIPAGYYSRLEGQTGTALMDSLTRIIGDSNSVRIHYGTWGTSWPSGERYEGTWSYFPVTDCHQDGRVWDMYSQNNRYYPAALASGCNLNIEHCLPNSWWGGETGCKRAYCDLYELNPADAKANQTGKSDYPLGKIDSTSSKDWTNGFCKNGLMKGHGSQRFFEPADEYKGDFARTWFYVLTCYHDAQWQKTGVTSGALDTTSYTLLSPWMRDLLLQWHRLDPVSQKEIDRQDRISSVQHNRNPFIDYPELVEYIWGTDSTSTLRLAGLTLTCDSAYQPLEDTTDLRVLPASNVSYNGFTARWSAWNEPLQLAIYQRMQEARYDTLFYMPAVTNSLINSTEHVSSNGQLNTMAAGTAACLMGKSSYDGQVYLTGVQYPAGSQLRLRLSKYYNASMAQVQVFAGTMLLKDTTWTSGDEFDCWLTLPQTDSISICSVGGSTSKRADLLRIAVLQQRQADSVVVLYSGRQSAGSVSYDFSATESVNRSFPVFYRLIQQNGIRSCEEEVELPSMPSALVVAKGVSQTTDGVLKEFHRGRLYICRDGRRYDVLGR